MRFLANENFPGAAVTALEAAGHDVVWVRTAAPGTSDPDVLAWAARERRILLTFDKDFGEARAGRLKIEPKVIWNTSEPLFPEARALAESTWGALVLNGWATSESIAGGFSCAVGPGFHIGEDMNVIEPVDARGISVRRGARSAKILLTNLYNRALPLIRYEITDEFEVADAPCPCGSSYLMVADVYGRAEDAFVYPGGIKVHPHVFRSSLGDERAIIAYQVRQTEQGVMIDVVNPSAAGLDGLRAAIEEQLRVLGLAAPSVGLRNVDAIARQTTGKLKRFVPLAP